MVIASANLINCWQPEKYALLMARLTFRSGHLNVADNKVQILARIDLEFF
jgi:hypothetical protein